MLLFIASLILPCVYLLLKFFSFAEIYTNLLEERCLFPESFIVYLTAFDNSRCIKSKSFWKVKIVKMGVSKPERVDLAHTFLYRSPGVAIAATAEIPGN